MDWAGAADVIKALSAAIGGAIAWTVARRDRKVKPTEKIAIDTVEALETTIQRKNEQIQSWQELYGTLERDYTRSREIIENQDSRLARKDQRIAHLELMVERWGIQA